MPNSSRAKHSCLSTLGTPKKIWAVSAIHSDLERLTAVHDEILSQFKVGDRIVYHGNYTGYGLQATDTIEEILAFRRLVLCIPGVLTSDFTYLRGQQEEMWEKLLQLPFAKDPTNILLWMLGNGIDPTLKNYGICPHEGIEACRQGTIGLNKWVSDIRTKHRRHPGHEELSCALSRAAFTDTNQDSPLLFVHTGLDANKKIDEQNDNFWWGSDKFQTIDNAYQPFKKVIRGYDPHHNGMHMNCVTSTIDGGCGFGGSLVCALFEQNGDIDHIIQK